MGTNLTDLAVAPCHTRSTVARRYTTRIVHNDTLASSPCCSFGEWTPP